MEFDGAPEKDADPRKLPLLGNVPVEDPKDVVVSLAQPLGKKEPLLVLKPETEKTRLVLPLPARIIVPLAQGDTVALAQPLSESAPLDEAVAVPLLLTVPAPDIPGKNEKVEVAVPAAVCVAVCVAVAVDGAVAADESVGSAVFVPVADALPVLSAGIPGMNEKVAVAVPSAVCVAVSVAAAVAGAVLVPVGDALPVLAADIPGT